jgi:hypothetical protein
MVTALIAALTVGYAPQTLEFVPTDDIWVYPHASDPQKDGYLRVWGVDGTPVATDPAAADEFSYSYLKFDLAKIPANAKLKALSLVLTHTADPNWSAGDSKAAPLQARILEKEFGEKTWDFGIARSVFPVSGKERVIGEGTAGKIESGKPIQFEIDLLKGPAKLPSPLGSSLRLALTSALDPAAIGNRAVYKFYSKDYDKAEYRPKLVVTFDSP